MQVYIFISQEKNIECFWLVKLGPVSIKDGKPHFFPLSSLPSLSSSLPFIFLPPFLIHFLMGGRCGGSIPVNETLPPRAQWQSSPWKLGPHICGSFYLRFPGLSRDWSDKRAQLLTFRKLPSLSDENCLPSPCTPWKMKLQRVVYVFYFPPSASRCQGIGVVQILLFCQNGMALKKNKGRKTVSAPSNFAHFFQLGNLVTF